ncbi:hypothetical protein PVAND_016596 [Polypedilum vanderplanki]|uniref:Peptidase S1 domain-containing protein n=1 Tax=Polypedilum vanderplanki TaxID=319348 RepID=A0A9J6BG88_POLVA|nr:hypothetical protein PVAND_016596 [Polypedilum vanderplanki]
MLIFNFLILLFFFNFEILNANVLRKGKIVGGYSADYYQFPYQASLRTALMSTHFCGAFLLTERWLMSAGHCTDKRKPSGVVVVVGAFTRAKDEGVKHNVLLLVTHPEFDAKSLQNDISMIKTETFIDFTISIRPVRLQAMPAEEGIEAFVSGWGYINSKGTNPDVLQWIKVKTINIDECREKMSKQNAERIFETNICADAMESTGSNGNGGACMGDSGGPLVTVDGALIGIVSWEVSIIFTN